MNEYEEKSYALEMAAQRAAEERMEWAIQSLDEDVDIQLAGPYCGCTTCDVREILAAAWPHLRDLALLETTRVDEGCTCGGVASCQQCQDRDARQAEVLEWRLGTTTSQRDRAEALLTAVARVLSASCHHCGRMPDSDGDHSCPCPSSDSECLEHTADPVVSLSALRAALGSAS